MGCQEREQETQCSPGDADKQALGHLLPDKGKPAATQGAAYCKFFPPGCATRHQQVRDIQAGDQQHTSHRTKQHNQRCLHVLHDIFKHGPRASLFRHGFRGIGEVDAVLQCAHLVGCGRSAHAGPEPGNDMALMYFVSIEPPRCKRRSVWHPELHLRVRIGEPAGQYADDFVRRAVESYLLAQDGGVSCEAPLKEAPCEQGNVVGPRLVFLGSKRASQC